MCKQTQSHLKTRIWVLPLVIQRQSTLTRHPLMKILVKWSQFLKPKLKNIRRFMAQPEGSMIRNHPPTSSFASIESSTHATAFHVSPSTSSFWIIDFGASDHMIGLSSVFSSYFIYSGHDEVRVADGTLSFISRKGNITISPTMSLSSVLHVPKFVTNLLSISCILMIFKLFSHFFFHLIVCFRTWIRSKLLGVIVQLMDSTSLMTMWILDCQQYVSLIVISVILVIKTG